VLLQLLLNVFDNITKPTKSNVTRGDQYSIQLSSYFNLFRSARTLSSILCPENTMQLYSHCSRCSRFFFFYDHDCFGRAYRQYLWSCEVQPSGGGVYGPTTFLTGVIHKAGAHTFLRVDDPVSRLGFPRRSTEVSPEVVVESQNGENW